jgi:hypothetical protein
MNGSAGPVCLVALQREDEQQIELGPGRFLLLHREEGGRKQSSLIRMDVRLVGQSEDGVFHGDARDAHELTPVEPPRRAGRHYA